MTRLAVRNEGYLGEFLSSTLEHQEPVRWVKVYLGKPGEGTYTDWFSQGDFRREAAETAAVFLKRGYSERRDKLPKDWKKRILGLETHSLKIEGTNGLVLKIGTIDIRRVAEIAKGGYVKNPRFDEEKRQILSRTEFLTEFRGCIADQLLNSNKYRDASELWQPPDDEELAKMIDSAGKVYDHYMSIPINSLMVTQDFIFPYVIGRKKFPELRWKDGKCCGHSSRGPRIPTADPCVHFTGIDRESRIQVAPVFRGNFNFSMEVINDTKAVPKQDEKDYVEKAVDSFGDIGSICIQHPPRKILEELGITPSLRNEWHPQKSELIKAVNHYLEIE